MIEQFHFLRPQWLLLLLPLILLVVLLWRRQRNQSSWQQLISPQLLSHLLEGETTPASRRPLLALLLGWVIATLALAGPSWEKLPQPLFKQQDALVLILDLSPSMLAEDLKPQRMLHAQHRLIDLLKTRKEGVTALVVYAGDAHVLAPLSADRETLLALAPGLDPSIMPVSGSQVEAAVAAALRLLGDAGYRRGELVLITDGVDAGAATDIRRQLQGSAYALSILGVGSAEGAPVPLRDGSFARDSKGNIHLARLDSGVLRQLATDSGGIYQDLNFDGSDITALRDRIEARRRLLNSGEARVAVEREFDLWADAGSWLVLLLLPIAALAHRRGWLLALLVAVPLLQPQPALALEWQDLWLNADQQGARALQRGDAGAAAQLFRSPDWKGAASYSDGNYAEALKNFSGEDADSWYNRGNALARDGQLEKAVEAWDQALKMQPEMSDAQFNRQLVEELLKQQQQQQTQSDQQDKGQQQNQDSQSGSSQQNSEGGDQQQSSEENARPQADAEQRSPQNGQKSGQQTPADTEDADTASQQESERRDVGSKEEAKSARQTEETPSSDPTAATVEQAGEADFDQQPAEAASGVDPQADSEQQQALDKWLRQLPEDPGGLLRRKFEYQYRQKLQAYQQGEWQPSDEVRW